MNNYKVEKEFEVDGFKCVIVGQNWGHRCGYIEIPSNHKYYGVGYDEIDIDIHGGWTYANVSSTYPIESPTNTYWIGFDCNHYCDAKDIELVKSFGDTRTTKYILENNHTYEDAIVRTMKYVENELRNAVKKLKEIA